jgi:hypothetical protein
VVLSNTETGDKLSGSAKKTVAQGITRRHGMENNAENQLLSFKLRRPLLHKSVTAFDIIFTGIGLIYHPLAGFKILIAL